MVQLVTYFQTHSRSALVAAVKRCISEQKSALNPATCLHPFRILISLLDKPDVGVAILEDVLLDILLYMHHACEFSKTSGKQASFNLLLESCKPFNGLQILFYCYCLLFQPKRTSFTLQLHQVF